MHKKFTQPFSLSDSLTPKGDQVSAISQIISGFNHQQQQTLLGVTGSGKTFTMANVIQEIALPTLIIAHNKTLAAQLYEEFRELFPNNAVEYFVSYYDYYQPEAYVPSSDTFIDKDSAINEAIDRMRHSATRALFERNDVIIVASVSCIYGLGSAEAYLEMLLLLNVGQEIDRDHVLRKLVELQYVRNDTDFFRGVFRVRGDVVEIFPAHEEDRAIRIEWFGDQIDSMSYIDPLRGKRLETLVKTAIYPNTHYAVTPEARTRALGTISQELKERLIVLQENNRFVEVQRLQERTEYDLEMIQQLGYCNGIENYSRHLSGRGEGVAPPTLIDYFPNEFLLCIDESHQTVPQVGAMYKGDRSRKSTLVEYGFRLPSALDNRPLQFDEFTALQHKVLYVSATPGDYEIERSDGVIVEQLIRPTGLLDPPIEVLPAKTQIDDLLEQIRTTVAKNERVLVTTLTKRMSEDLTEFLAESGIKVRYLHSDIKTIERTEILHDLRRGEFDVLVGINLLREGIDLPEVSLVAILDADKEGFLRSYRSLVQTIGRAARNINGRAILYADKITKSMQLTIEETERRREKQHQHNLDHHIVPTSITKPIRSLHPEALVGKDAPKMKGTEDISYAEIPARMKVLKQEMLTAAKALNFELAAELRDELKALEKMHLALS